MKKLLLFASMMALPLTANAQMLLNENFQSGSIPATWTVAQTNTVQTWSVSDLGASDFRATVDYDPLPGAQNEMLITPSMDFTTATSFTLKANIGLSYYWSVDPENNYDAFIKISTDNGATWTQLWSENDLGVFTNWTMNPVVINLDSYVGNPNVKIAFQYVGLDGAALYVDNVVVAAPPTAAPNCATPTSPANGATGIVYNSVNLTWTAPTTGSEAASYDVYLDKNANPTTLVGNVTGTSYTALNLDASSTYYWRVVPKNAAGSATGCSVFSFTTIAPTYCTAGATNTSFEKISNVSFADINNNSTSTAGYEDFSQVVGNVTAGQPYPFTASFTGTSFGDDQVLVWIDFNNDKDFADAGEQVLVTPKKTSPWTGTITIPANTSAGQVRMRVRLHDSVLTPNLTPCGTSSFGQVEDYTLNITALAVSDVSKTQVKVYPNPVVDILNVEAASKVSTVQVFDLTGKVVSSHALSAVKNQVDLSKLAPGVYVVNIQTENGTQSVKIVKK